MPAAFGADAIRIGTLFSGDAVYVTPGFQRPIVWSPKEVGQLLDDLLFALDAAEGREPERGVFFLGTVVLIYGGTSQGVDGGPAVTRYDIIDGQQRLATLTLLFAVLRDLARTEGDDAHAEALQQRLVAGPIGTAGPWRLTIRPDDAEVMIECVQRAGACLAAVDTDALEGPKLGIVLNRDHLVRELGALDAATRRRLAAFIEERCQVVVIVTDDADSAYRIFTIVNQPGKPLARNDILKAELIGQIAPEGRAWAIAAWDRAEAANGEDFEQLFSHVRAALGNAREPVLREMRRLVQAGDGAEAFLLTRLLPMANAHAAMLGRSVTDPAGEVALPVPARALLSHLRRLGHGDWVPAALLWIDRHRHDPAGLTAFLTALDRVAIGHLLLNFGGGRRVTAYARIIEAIRDGGRPHEEPGLMEFNQVDQRNILYNATNDPYGRNTACCRLLLIRLNDALAGAPSGLDGQTVTVEHVLPRRPAQRSRWREWFPDAVREHYAGSLGNLVLVEARTNKAVRNFDFDRKTAAYAQDTHMGRLPLNAGVAGLAEFRPEQVEHRERRLIGTLRQLWGWDAPLDRQPPA